MPTSAEADRQALEDRMVQAALAQANARRTAMQDKQRMGSDARDIAQIQSNAQLEAARIMAGAESARQDALGKREAAAIEARKGMSEAEKAQLAMMQEDRALNPERMYMQEVFGNGSAVEAAQAPVISASIPATKAVRADPYRQAQPEKYVNGQANPAFLNWYQNRYGPESVPTGYPGADMSANSAERLGANVEMMRNIGSQDLVDANDNPVSKRGEYGLSTDGPWLDGGRERAGAGAWIRGADGLMYQIAAPQQAKTFTSGAPTTVDDGVKAVIDAAAASATKPAMAQPAQTKQPEPKNKPLNYTESREGKLARAAGKQQPLADRIGERRAIQAQADIDAATQKLMTGDYAGEDEKTKLLSIIDAAGGEAPAVIGRGKAQDISAISGDPEFLSAVQDAQRAVAGVRGDMGWEGNTGGGSAGALVKDMINQRASAIAKRTGVPVSIVSREIADQATRGQKGVSPGFWSGLGNMAAEVGTLGYAETTREAMLKRLADDFMLDAYRQSKAQKSQ